MLKQTLQFSRVLATESQLFIGSTDKSGWTLLGSYCGNALQSEMYILHCYAHPQGNLWFVFFKDKGNVNPHVYCKID